MDDRDLIALAAIAITVLGWVATFLSQMATLQQQSRIQTHLARMVRSQEIEKELRQHGVYARLEELDRIAAWLDRGMGMVMRLRNYPIQKQANPILTRQKHLRETLDANEQWVIDVNPRLVEAIRNDPEDIKDMNWPPLLKFDDPLPEMLPSQILCFTHVVNCSLDAYTRDNAEELQQLHRLLGRIYAEATSKIGALHDHRLSQVGASTRNKD